MVTLDSVLDDAMKLDNETREMLVEILRKRQIEAQRAEILREGKKALKEYRAGKLKPQTAEEIIAKLSKL